MTLTEFCSSLDERLSAQPSDKERLEIMVKAISQTFKVRPEEVAIFSFDRELEIIRFLWPLRLRNAGSIPLSAHNSLVIETVLKNRAALDNYFSTTPHSSVFEQFRLGPEIPPMPIQKIMSVPLFANGEIKGAIQISRKAPLGNEAGDNFSTNQLAALSKVAEVCARYI
ncbi:MAG TPA: GAF domain-containing protein [Dongiaceae bacterium]|nr:GAF domain-containing protein [Dongiaceae bacterium]